MALPVWGSKPTTAYGQALPLYITVRNRRDSGQVLGRERHRQKWRQREKERETGTERQKRWRD